MKVILILSDLNFQVVKAVELPVIPTAGDPIIIARQDREAGYLTGRIGRTDVWVLLGSDLIPHINIMLDKGIDLRTGDALKAEGWCSRSTTNDVLLTCRALHDAGIKTKGVRK